MWAVLPVMPDLTVLLEFTDARSHWFVGHIIGQQPPGPLSWVAAIALFGGIGGGIVGRTPLVRRCCWTLAVLGLIGTIADTVIRSQPPTRPNLTVTLASPGRRSGPEAYVRVCGYTRQGHSSNPTANGRHLLVRVDGMQRAEVRTRSVALPVPYGSHVLSVEITSADHRAFQPPILIIRRVHVSPLGPEQKDVSCRRRA